MRKPEILTRPATDLSFAMYNAFTDVPYSGSQSAIVLNASTISAEKRAKIAQEIGAPATSFVDEVCGNRVKVQFFSTVMELPMCGHGTVCLITRLVEINLLPNDGDGWHKAILDLPGGEAVVQYNCNSNGRTEVMLDVAPAIYTPANLDMDELAQCLGVDASAYAQNLPPEIATGDFIHLCLPMRDRSAITSLQPDFSGLAAYCVANGLETVATFSTETLNPERNLHVRDFCPAVGVAESAAAGTTNAALAGYLLRKGLVSPDAEGMLTVQAEQGIKLGRPSHVTSLITTDEGRIERLQVGGIASRIMDGFLNTETGAA